jgi:hypothetical protein
MVESDDVQVVGAGVGVTKHFPNSRTATSSKSGIEEPLYSPSHG